MSERIRRPRRRALAVALGAIWAGPALGQDAVPALTQPPAPMAPADGVPMPMVPTDSGPAVGSATPGAEAAPGGAAPNAPDSAVPAGQAPDAGGFKWKDVPRIRPLPRPGFFPNPPSGPGYYTLIDQIRGDKSEKPPKFPYPRVGPFMQSFFDADNFSYLDDPKNEEFDWSDPLHRIRFGDWLFVTGGEVRGRYENRYNDRLLERNNTYGLGRIRAYADLWYKDDFRVFAEFNAAGTAWQDLAPLPRDENRADIKNLFVDVKLFEYENRPVYGRVGRQELLFGSQRLVSPLDWANDRRTFDGVRVFRQGEKFDVDGFWASPVLSQPSVLDSSDRNQNFAGFFGTYRPEKGQAIDAYYFMLDNVNRVRQQNIQRSPNTLHTFGSRYSGNKDNFLFDTEGAMQLGTVDQRNLVGGFFTQGVGYNFKDTPWKPTLWAYYDYASGGGPNTGTAQTFNQLFPFGHYYMGWVDQVGRQNIHDVNFHLYAYPTNWITTWVQFHNFWLADPRDALYNAAGNAIRRDATGRAGQFVGHEVDLVMNFHLTKHIDVFTGYSYLFGGEFLERTSSPTLAKDTSFFFLQTSYKW